MKDLKGGGKDGRKDVLIKEVGKLLLLQTVGFSQKKIKVEREIRT